MKLNFIKFHLYLFEVISIIASIWIICFLLISMIAMGLNSGVNSNNQLTTLISFRTDSSDMSKIKIVADEVELLDIDKPLSVLNRLNQGYIVINKKKINFEGLSKFEIVEKINMANLENCFIFRENSAMTSVKGIFSEMQKDTKDFLNLAIFLFVVLFICSLKINMFRLNKSMIKNLAKDPNNPILFKKKYFFSYIIQHLSLVLIIPVLFREYYDYQAGDCLGFADNYFNSFFLDRTIIYNHQKDDLSLFSKLFDNNDKTHPSLKTEFKNNLFYLYSLYSLEGSVFTHSYMINILFLCMMVWVSGLFVSNVLDSNINQNLDLDLDDPEEKRAKLNYSAKKQLALYIWNFTIFSAWILFFFFGLVNLIDILNFYHRLIYYNFSKLLNFRIFSYLLFTYLHIYFYLFLIYYSIYSLIQNKKKSINTTTSKTQMKTTENDFLIKTPVNNVDSELKEKFILDNVKNINENSGLVVRDD